MGKNRFIMTLCMAIGIIICHAQNSKKNQDEFDAFRTEMHRDFNSFRAEIMSQYIKFIKNPWKSFESVDPIPQPKLEPIPPVVVPKDNQDTIIIESKPIVIEEVIKPVLIAPQPKPIEGIPENDNNNDISVNFDWFGTPLKVRFYRTEDFHINNVSKDAVANALTVLASENYDNSIIDCLKIREDYKLCDWAYLLFVQQFANEACKNNYNDATLFTAYILLQSGYKIRFAFSEERLYVLYASKHCMFNKISYSLDNEYYYGLVELPSQLMISEAKFPKEQSISLQISMQPKLAKNLTPKRIISSKTYPNFNIETQVNKNLLSFYETYPCSYYNDNIMTLWAQYANTPMDDNIVSTVYPVMKHMLEGLNEEEQVSRILNWVQTGFTYEFDDKVWGYDRTFFSEESLFYPYCDCEDRSVLLTRLIRDLVGLECVLIYYPGHLATAVKFTTPTNGDYVIYEGKRFVVCDPTYIGASVGATMPGMDNVKASIIVLR